MSRDAVFSGSIPHLYERYLVPLIFEPYAQDLAARVSPLRSGRVLEIAAGTGVVTRAMAKSLPASVEITATDLNQAMLDHGEATMPAGRTTWQRADAQALPFEDATFDAVVCQFGVMFFPDRRGAFAEMRRVLKPGGLLAFNTWDRIEENELPHEVTKAAAVIFEADPPTFMMRTPHGYFDEQAIRSDVGSAGLGSITFDTVVKRSVAASCRDPAIGFCQGTPMRHEIETRDASRLGDVTDAAARRIEARFGPGPVDGKIQAHVVTARA